MKITRNYLIAGTIFLFVVSLFIVFKIDIFENDINLICAWEAEMKEKSFKGEVIAKFLDERNHMSPTIILLEAENKKIDFPNESSGFYEFLIIGDYIDKSKKSLEVNIIRDSMVIRKELDYGCIE